LRIFLVNNTKLFKDEMTVRCGKVVMVDANVKRGESDISS
jgi:hypothetical protein